MNAPNVASFPSPGEHTPDNILLANFLGTCSFISISKDFISSMGLGLAVTMVIGICAAICWAVLNFLIRPLAIEYLSFIFLSLS
jgi:Na+-transporting NADH:ubiquinone oxidoreductase subunit E